jgi:hypothetical protein
MRRCLSSSRGASFLGDNIPEPPKTRLKSALLGRQLAARLARRVQHEGAVQPGDARAVVNDYVHGHDGGCGGGGGGRVDLGGR